MTGLAFLKNKKNIRRIFFALLIAATVSISSTQVSFAGKSQNGAGFAWGGTTDNVVPSPAYTGMGWLSFNNISDASTPDYGVNIPTTDGALSGYAWSENYGWISFNSSDLAGCSPTVPTFSAATRTGNNITGGARILGIKTEAEKSPNNAGGFDGCISLFNVTISGNALAGYGWSSDLGWIDFSGVTNGGATPPPPPPGSCPAPTVFIPTGSWRYPVYSSTATWTAPDNVTSVSVVVVGGGGAGGYPGTTGGAGGDGGGLAYKNDIAVTPGATYNLTVGMGGPAHEIAPTHSSGGTGFSGGNSSFTAGFGTITATGGTGGYINVHSSPTGGFSGGEGGGNGGVGGFGGNGSSYEGSGNPGGGGGAGGYTGAGGKGGDYNSFSGGGGTGGGGGGGNSGGNGGGGVGGLGVGPSGNGGGKGGSGGTNGGAASGSVDQYGYYHNGAGGLYGGGGGGAGASNGTDTVLNGAGGNGVVVISACRSCAGLWGGPSVPSGTSVTAYKTPSVAPPNCDLPSNKETRTCNNGTWSGSYTNQTQTCIGPCNTPAIPSTPPDCNTALTASIASNLYSTGGDYVYYWILNHNAQYMTSCYHTTSQTTWTQSPCNNGSGCWGTTVDPSTEVGLNYISGKSNMYRCVGGFVQNHTYFKDWSNMQGSNGPLPCVLLDSCPPPPAVSCSAITIGTCDLSATPSGGSSGSCHSGYSGSCSYSCNNGTWNMSSNSCVVLNPTVSISANPTRVRSVPPNNTSTITWSASGVKSCEVTGPSGKKLASGNADNSNNFSKSSPYTAIITAQSTYTIVCKTNSADVSQSVTVNIVPAFQEF